MKPRPIVRSAAAALVAAAALIAPAGADVVRFKNGQSLEGVVVEEGGQVKIHSAVGTIGFPAALVLRIERGDSREQQVIERLQALAPNDIQGRVDLALELERAGSTTLAQRVYQSVLDRDPDDPIARRALGYVRCDDEWLSTEECHRSRGDVLYQGKWMAADQKSMLEAIDHERQKSELERLRSDLEVETARLRAEREAAASYSGYGGGSDPYYYDPYYYGGGYPYYPYYPTPLRPNRGDGRFDGRHPEQHGPDRGRPSGNVQGGLHHQGGQPARPLMPTHSSHTLAPPRR